MIHLRLILKDETDIDANLVLLNFQQMKENLPSNYIILYQNMLLRNVDFVWKRFLLLDLYYQLVGGAGWSKLKRKGQWTEPLIELVWSDSKWAGQFFPKPLNYIFSILHPHHIENALTIEAYCKHLDQLRTWQAVIARIIAQTNKRQTEVKCTSHLSRFWWRQSLKNKHHEMWRNTG